jgi:hypothetical protein
MTKSEYYEVVLDNYRPARTLIAMIPADKLNWKPGPTFMSMGQLICHLSDGLGGGFEMMLSGKWPSMKEMDEGMKLENLPSCTIQEAIDRLEKDKKLLHEVLGRVSETDFTNRVVTVPWGMTAKLERMAISFLEHFGNHKMQLFTYLPVNTGTLYGM